MKRTILAAALLAGTAFATLPAQADFVLHDETFANLGATGFGNAPRLLTLQNSGLESGAVVSNGGTQGFLSPITVNGTFDIVGIPCNSNQSCSGGGLSTGANESKLVNVTSLWTSGAQVGVGLDTNQTGSSDGLLFSELVLNIYSSTGVVLGTFGGNDAVLITPQLLALQQGNGNSVFNLGLNSAEQAEFNAILAGLPLNGQIFAGLGAVLGCNTAGCVGAADDGAESFLAFRQSAATVPGPVVGGGIPGLIAACSGLFGLNFWRRRRNGGALAAYLVGLATFTVRRSSRTPVRSEKS